MNRQCRFFFYWNFIVLLASDCQGNQIWWTRTEFLFWSIKKQDVCAPLATRASFADPLPGALGQPETRIELGGDTIKMPSQKGFKVSAGTCLCQENRFGAEASYFLLPKSIRRQSITTSGEPGSENIAVPVFDVTGVWGLNGVPGETVALLSGPLFGGPGFAGNFNIRLRNRLQSAEVNGLCLEESWCCVPLVLLAGFRWVQLQESLRFAARTRTVANVSFPQGFFNFCDGFKTTNNFYGAQLGVRGFCRWACLQLETTLKVGLGAVITKKKIDGASRTATGNLFFLTHDTADDLLTAGIFTQPSNIGISRQHFFAVLGEATIRGSYQVYDNIGITLGYNFLVVNKVVRPGDQIDHTINATRTRLADASRATVGTGAGPIPVGMPGPAPLASGPRDPAVLCRTSNFWAQGLIAGIMVTF